MKNQPAKAFKGRPHFIAMLTLGTLTTAPSIFSQGAQANGGEEDLFEVSPFEVKAEENNGYRATSTLAGTRIKTNLKDVGSAISVVTTEMMRDLGANNSEELLVYTLGTEVGGAVGNFGGAAIAAGDESGNRDARANPESNNRVRGLSRAQSTRDYFLTAFGFDSYNSTGVTVSRGPNSILFGIGEPGGIIENSLKKAQLNEDEGEVSLRFGKRDSHRETFDYNKVLVEGRLAIRLMGVNETVNFKQQPTFEDDQRFTVAATWKALKNENVSWLNPTLIRANYEEAEIRSTPPNTMPPGDAFHYWWHPEASVAADSIIGEDRTEYREDYAPQWVIDDMFRQDTTSGTKRVGRAGVWNTYAFVFPDIATGSAGVGTSQNDVQVMDPAVGSHTVTLEDGTEYSTFAWGGFRGTSRYEFNPLYPGFKDKVLMNSEIFDYNNYFYPGRIQYSNHDFKAQNFSIEQNLFDNKLGFQLSFDKQEKDSERSFSFGRFNYHKIYIDTQLYNSNGERNPNVGRPMLSGRLDGRDFNEDTRESTRLTAYYNLDFTNRDGWAKWLGNNTVTGLVNKWENDRRGFSLNPAPDDSHDPEQRFVTNHAKYGHGNAAFALMAYIGDPLFDVTRPEDVRLYNGYLNIEKPQVGQRYTNYYYDKVSQTLNYSTIGVQEGLVNPSGTYQEIDSEALTWQGKFFEDHVVLTYGWREDSTDTWRIRNNSFRDPDTFFYDRDVFLDGWGQEDGSVGPRSDADVVLSESGQTTTKQAVVHMPKAWLEWSSGAISSVSAHFAQSENFNPASVRHDFRGDLIGSPSGETDEFGFSFGLFEDKAHARFTWYETSSLNATNTNINGRLWEFRGLLPMAQRWVSAKNNSFNEGGLQFEDIAWYGPNGAGPDREGAEYRPELIGSFQSFDEVIDALLSAWTPEMVDDWEVTLDGEEGSQSISYTQPSGLSSVAGAFSKGFEAEVVFNPTQNWRVAFNASKTESSFGGGLQVIEPVYNELVQNLKNEGLWEVASRPGSSSTDVGTQYSNGAGLHLAAAKAKEDNVVAELRKWRWNLVTNYRFSEGPLKGFGIGGAMRWLDKVATGYPLVRNSEGVLAPDLANPFYGDARLKGDVWFSYKTKVFDMPVRFQLNLQNYLGDDGDIPVATNPDGELAIVRTAEEKRAFFTTTISF
ncbi:TonB-dependent receptor plug domain-containing protein [Pelagicoccus sp. SDUM812005]|uniref:TonB-dependent receptor plug domain-containing protein n=1 Tax=Pelagicoccus sp. SDUM812005 TaxID=3041257 RepID=UPI00280E5086|nr:TonB-dependent receptor plug domain-containing protein [Pelagicoccus sp. SDUM812005]MDQ8180335.1 hypothetical protein [Pelagicoccus sp. SDUM812005]